MKAQPVPVNRRSGHLMATATVSIVLTMLLCLLITAALTHGYVVLLPDRSNDALNFGLLMGMAALIVMVVRILRFRPELKGRFFTGVLMFGVTALLLGTVLGTGLAGNLLTIYDFRHRPLNVSNGFIRVSRFHKTSGRGTSYHLALTDFSPDLDLDYDDYRCNVGDRNGLAVAGKCIQARLERSGTALRMVQPKHVRARPCPAGPVVIS